MLLIKYISSFLFDKIRSDAQCIHTNNADIIFKDVSNGNQERTII